MDAKRIITASQQRQTYFLVVGEVVIQLSDDTVPTAVRLNTVVMNKDGKFPLALIAKAQQALQFQLHKKADDPSVKVVDVIILGLMNLGQFTTEEFNARPVGLDMRDMSEVQVLS